MRDQLPSFSDQAPEINQDDRINTRSLLSGSDNTALKLIMPTLTSIIDRLENDKKLNDQRRIKQSIENERLLARTQLLSNSFDSLITKQSAGVDLLKELLEAVKGLRGAAGGGGISPLVAAAGGAAAGAAAGARGAAGRTPPTGPQIPPRPPAPPTVPPVPPPPATPVPSQSPSTAATAARTAGRILTGPAVPLAMGAYEAVTGVRQANEDLAAGRITEEQATEARSAAVGQGAGGAGGALAGAALGATVGSAVPVVGTAIGGVVGGIAGYAVGSEVGRQIGSIVGTTGPNPSVGVAQNIIDGRLDLKFEKDIPPFRRGQIVSLNDMRREFNLGENEVEEFLNNLLRTRDVVPVSAASSVRESSGLSDRQRGMVDRLLQSRALQNNQQAREVAERIASNIHPIPGGMLSVDEARLRQSFIRQFGDIFGRGEPTNYRHSVEGIPTSNASPVTPTTPTSPSEQTAAATPEPQTPQTPTAAPEPQTPTAIIVPTPAPTATPTLEPTAAVSPESQVSPPAQIRRQTEAERIVDRELRSMNITAAELENYDEIREELIRGVSRSLERNVPQWAIGPQVNSYLTRLIIRNAVELARRTNDEFMNLLIAHIPVFRDRPLVDKQINTIRLALSMNATQYPSWLIEKYNRQISAATPERHSSLDSGIMDALTSGFDRSGSDTAPRTQGTMYAQAPDQSGVMSDAQPAQPDATRVEEPAPEAPVAMAEPQSTTQQEGARETNRDLTFGPGVDRRIEQGIATKVGQIESSFGKRLIVTSGFRDSARNARVGGARNSAHTRGNAVDVTFSGNEQDTIKLIEVASSAGIGGIGVYRPGWVHLDTESKRVWGPDFSARSIPQWARRALDAHMTGRRDGAQATPVETPAGQTPEQPHAEPAERGEMSGGELMSGATAPSATPTAGVAPTGGMQVMQASQENAVAERTPSPPAVAPSMSTPAGEASPGTSVPTTQQSATDPGRVEPEDAAERYARMFNMAA